MNSPTHNERTLTTLEYALLGLSNIKPSSGYELCKVFETTPMGHYSSSPGAIYPALKRLERRKLLNGTVEKADSMRPRRVFSITGEGLELLRSWMRKPVSQEDLVWREEELMLRFSFMGSVIDRSAIIVFLSQIQIELETLIAGLEEHLSGMKSVPLPEGVMPTGALALQFGIDTYRSLRQWAATSMDALTHH